MQCNKSQWSIFSCIEPMYWSSIISLTLYSYWFYQGGYYRKSFLIYGTGNFFSLSRHACKRQKMKVMGHVVFVFRISELAKVGKKYENNYLAFTIGLDALSLSGTFLSQHSFSTCDTLKFGYCHSNSDNVAVEACINNTVLP